MADENKLFVLLNIPNSCDKAVIKSFVEETVKLEVLEVHLHHFIHGRALIILKENITDLNSVQTKFNRSTLEGKNVSIIKANKKPAIVIHLSDFKKFTLEFFIQYLETAFADSSLTIEMCCYVWPEYSVAVLHFNDKDQYLVSEILDNKSVIEKTFKKYHLRLDSFFTNFHEYIGQTPTTDFTIVVWQDKEIKHQNTIYINQQLNSGQFPKEVYKKSEKNVCSNIDTDIQISHSKSSRMETGENLLQTKITGGINSDNINQNTNKTNNEKYLCNNLEGVEEKKLDDNDEIGHLILEHQTNVRAELQSKNVYPISMNKLSHNIIESIDYEKVDHDSLYDKQKKQNVTCDTRGANYRERDIDTVKTERTEYNFFSLSKEFNFQKGLMNIRDKTTKRHHSLSDDDTSDDNNRNPERFIDTLTAEDVKKQNSLGNDKTCENAEGLSKKLIELQRKKQEILKENINLTVVIDKSHSIENKNPTVIGFRNTFEKSSMVSGQTDGNHCDDLSETKMNQNNRTINPNATFDSEKSTKKLEETKSKNDEESESGPNEDQDKKVITEDEFENGNSHDEHDEQQGKLNFRGNSYRGEGSVVMKSKCGTVKNVRDSTDEESDDSGDEQDEQRCKFNSRRNSYRGEGSVVMKSKCGTVKNVRDSTDEESDDSGDEQDEHQGKLDYRGNSYRGRGGVVMKSKGGTVKKVIESTDKESNDSGDEQDEHQGKLDYRGNSYRGRGGVVMKSKGGTVKKVIASTDEESDDSGDEQDEHQGKLDYRGNSYRGRGGVVMKSKGGTVKKVIESTDEESNDSGDEQDEHQGKLDYRGNSYRGRGGVVMKSKGGTVKKVIASTDEESNDGDEQDEQRGKLDFRGNSYRDRDSIVMKSKCGTVKNVKGDNTDEDIYNDNSNKEQEKHPGTMNTRKIPYRGGRGSSFFKAKNIKSKQDVNTIMTSENKLSNDNTCYRASNLDWGNINRNTTNSTQIFKDHGNNNDEGSIENINTVFYSRGRGFAGRGCRKNTFEKLSMVSGQTDGNNRGDLSETKMSQNNRTINPNPTFDKENSTKDLSKRVEELKKRKQEISEENARLAVESHSIPLTEIQAKCLQCYMKEYVECDIRYDSNLKSAILKGPKHKMQKCQLDFLLELKKVKEMEISLNNDVQNILSSEKGHTFLKNLNDLELKSAFVCLDSNSLKVGALDDVALNESTKMIKEKIEYAETLEGKSEFPLDQINLLKLKIENKYNTRVKWDTQKTQLIILGIKDDVLIARKEAEMFLEKFGV